jgi:hypothetical protein
MFSLLVVGDCKPWLTRSVAKEIKTNMITYDVEGSPAPSWVIVESISSRIPSEVPIGSKNTSLGDTGET